MIRNQSDERTASQMIEAPMNAAYICPDPRSAVNAKDLAKELGREDLKVVDRRWLISPSSEGWSNAVVLDHAMQQSLIPLELDTLDRIRLRLRI